MELTTEKATNGTAPERQLKRSIKKDDYANGGALQLFLLPQYGLDTAVALPQYLPKYNWYGFNRRRDIVALSARRKEAMWATAIGVAIAKMSSLSWQVESDIAIRRKRAQQWLLNAGAGSGLFGWVPFISAHLQAYLSTGLGFIEIERSTPANGSRVINIHHLNPLRCRLTGNPRKPVNYLTRHEGKVVELHWHQVMVISDMLDPTEGELGQVESATERAWAQITKLAAIELMIYEKVSGTRPTALQFIGGINNRNIQDAIQSSREEAARKGLQLYMGAAVIPVMSDIPLNLVTVPLKDFPDGFDAQTERQRADVIYSNAIGLDPQDLNPQLVGRQGLGSAGNQSIVLAEKQKGRGLASWASQFQQMLNELALDDKTLFTFVEKDRRDEKAEADIEKTRQDTRENMISSGMISTGEARNLAVDDGDLPNEFISTDHTHQGTLSDLDKPEEEKPKEESTELPALPQPAPKKTKSHEIYEWSKGYY